MARLYPVDALGDYDDLPKRLHERVVEIREPLVRSPPFDQLLPHYEAARIPVDFRRQRSHNPVSGVHEQVRHAEGELKLVAGVPECDDAEHEHEGADERQQPIRWRVRNEVVDVLRREEQLPSNVFGALDYDEGPLWISDYQVSTRHVDVLIESLRQLERPLVADADECRK